MGIIRQKFSRKSKDGSADPDVAKFTDTKNYLYAPLHGDKYCDYSMQDEAKRWDK